MTNGNACTHPRVARVGTVDGRLQTELCQDCRLSRRSTDSGRTWSPWSPAGRLDQSAPQPVLTEELAMGAPQEHAPHSILSAADAVVSDAILSPVIDRIEDKPLDRVYVAVPLDALSRLRWAIMTGAPVRSSDDEPPPDSDSGPQLPVIEQRFVPAKEGDVFLPVNYRRLGAVAEKTGAVPYELGNVMRGAECFLPARRLPDGSVLVLDETQDVIAETLEAAALRPTNWTLPEGGSLPLDGRPHGRAPDAQVVPGAAHEGDPEVLEAQRKAWVAAYRRSAAGSYPAARQGPSDLAAPQGPPQGVVVDAGEVERVAQRDVDATMAEVAWAAAKLEAVPADQWNVTRVRGEPEFGAVSPFNDEDPVVLIYAEEWEALQAALAEWNAKTRAFLALMAATLPKKSSS